jgi:aquaporin Z
MPQKDEETATLSGELSREFSRELGRLFAEFFGTFALTFFDCGAKIVGTLSGEVDHLAQALAPGLIVAAMIYSIGSCSGAHINPAVTFAFALRGVFPWLRVPGYWLAQVSGALFAAWLLEQLFGNVEHLGATIPRGAFGVSFLMETVLTFMLVCVILGTAVEYRVIGPHAAVGVGATIVACGILGKSVSGASMNPARSLGPALMSGASRDIWIYVLGPFSGALLAVGAAFILYASRKKDEEKAAQGEGAGEKRDR